MMFFRAAVIFVQLIIAGVGYAVAADLERDPFAPIFGAPGSGRPSALTGASRGQKFGIRGILVSGEKSLVNFNGKIIGIGEEQDGYRLLQVEQEYVVFERGNDIIKMSLYVDEDDE